MGCAGNGEYGPPKTHYNRWKRWSDMGGGFARIMEGFAAEGTERKRITIDATHLKADRTASSLRLKKGAWQADPLPGRVLRSDSIGRPIRFFITVGQVSDYTGARALMGSLPAADWLPGDRGYDADWFGEDVVDKGISPCIPERKSRDKPVRYDKRCYKRRSRIEIMFGRLKDWRRVATRYDRCPKIFLSAIALAVPVLFWL